MLIGNTVLYGNNRNQKKEFFNMIAQNWMTDKEANKNSAQVNNGNEEKPNISGNNLFISRTTNFKPTTSHIKHMGQ